MLKNFFIKIDHIHNSKETKKILKNLMINLEANKYLKQIRNILKHILFKQEKKSFLKEIHKQLFKEFLKTNLLNQNQACKVLTKITKKNSSY